MTWRKSCTTLVLAAWVLLSTDPSYGQVGVAGDPVLKTADLIVYESGAGNGLIATGSGGMNIDFINVVDGVGATSSNSGFELGGTGGAQFGLLQGCSDAQVLKWTESTSLWECQPDVGSNPLTLTSCEALTISTGAVTLTGAANTITCHTIDTESAASQDDLTTMNCTAGSWHLITAANTARTVTVIDGAGVLVQADFNMDNTEDKMFLECSATNTVNEISRANNGA